MGEFVYVVVLYGDLRKLSTTDFKLDYKDNLDSFHFDG